MTPVLVIGIGNETRGDDGAGLLAARRIREMARPGVRVLELTAEPSDLIDAWRGARRVYVIDCAAPVGQPGTIRRFAAHDTPLPASLGAVSSHGMGLVAAIELARALDELPDRLIVYAIEGTAFAAGARPHPTVRKAAGDVARAICGELAQHSAMRSSAET